MRQSLFLIVLVVLSVIFSVASAKSSPMTAYKVNERIKALCGEKCNSKVACIRRCHNYVLGLPEIAETLARMPSGDGFTGYYSAPISKLNNAYGQTRVVGTPSTSRGSSSIYRYSGGGYSYAA